MFANFSSLCVSMPALLKTCKSHLDVCVYVGMYVCVTVCVCVEGGAGDREMLNFLDVCGRGFAAKAV